MENILIIGSGPAGHTAAIYSSRANLNPLMYEGFLAGGVAAGGQLTTTTDVENFPGFPEGISGPALMDKMREQSLRFGTRIETETIKKVDLSSSPFKATAEDGTIIEAKVIIIATGATAKRLNLKGEDTYWQKGISACAVCDGANPMFKNKELAVIGGGDSAAEEALFLTKYASKVYLLVRKDEMRASKVMADRVKNSDKIEILWNTEATEVTGDNVLQEIKLMNNATKETSSLKVNGLFYAIGHVPNTAFLDNQIDLHDNGYIKTKDNSTATSVAGVFACGDVQDAKYRQAITAAGSGCMSALEAEHYLSSL